MNKKDKDNMIILGALVGIIFLFFFFNFKADKHNDKAYKQKCT